MKKYVFAITTLFVAITNQAAMIHLEKGSEIIISLSKDASSFMKDTVTPYSHHNEDTIKITLNKDIKVEEVKKEELCTEHYYTFTNYCEIRSHINLKDFLPFNAHNAIFVQKVYQTAK